VELNKFIRLAILERKISLTGGCLYQYNYDSEKQETFYTLLNWRTYRMLADLTKYVHYGCDFTELGCKAYRIKSKKELEKLREEGKKRGRPYWREMCCCGGCRGAFGYLHHFPIEGLTTIARCFHYKTGFWREGKGCVLPRKYRSYTCLNYACGGHKSETVQFLFKALKMSEREILNYYERRYKKHKLKGRYHWTIEGVVAHLKGELLKERKERRKKRAK
jgi:hypothetical protein